MKRIFFSGAFIICLAACNANRSGSGGNPSEDSVAPATQGKGYSNDVGNGSTGGGTSDPMNGAGPQTLNNGTQPTDTSTKQGAPPNQVSSGANREQQH